MTGRKVVLRLTIARPNSVDSSWARGSSTCSTSATIGLISAPSATGASTRFRCSGSCPACRSRTGAGATSPTNTAASGTATTGSRTRRRIPGYPTCRRCGRGGGARIGRTADPRRSRCAGGRASPGPLTLMFPGSTMFPVTGNNSYLGNIVPTESDLIIQAERLLADRLGQGWGVRRCDEPIRGPDILQPDAILSMTAPDGSKALQMVAAKQRVFPRDVLAWLSALRPVPRDSTYLLAAPFLSPRARILLEEAGVNYIDMTGNMLVRVERPSIFVRQQGSDKDPAPGDEPVRSLRGGKAARVVRALCDYREPATSRSVAARAGVTPGYVSKIIGVLERDALVEREGRGPVQPITRVLWADLIRRWSADYRVLESNTSRLFLAPQGIPACLRDLAGWASRTPSGRYAVTGSFAAAQRAPVAPPSTLVCYVDAPVGVAEKTGLMLATVSYTHLTLPTI